MAIKQCPCGHVFNDEDYDEKSAMDEKTGKKTTILFADCDICGRTIVADGHGNIKDGYVVNPPRLGHYFNLFAAGETEKSRNERPSGLGSLG